MAEYDVRCERRTKVVKPCPPCPATCKCNKCSKTDAEHEGASFKMASAGAIVMGILGQVMGGDLAGVLGLVVGFILCGIVAVQLEGNHG